MGMVMEIFAVREETLRHLLDDPPLVWQLVSPDEPEIYEEVRAEYMRRAEGLLARLFKRTAPRGQPATLTLESGEGPVADLDKAWHGIHYLFTGAAEAGEAPMDFLVVGGKEIGDVEVGYGPSRALAPETVHEIGRRLASLPDATLLSRFNPVDMRAKKIYPDIWTRDPKDGDTLKYLAEYLVALRRAVTEAVDRGFGLVIVLR